MAEENISSENLGAYKQVYDDTLYFIDGMTSEYELYPPIISMLRDGNMSLELKKRYTMKAIDEMWISTIEDSLIALDHQIRNPSRFIEENEKVLPIEFSKHITSRSIQHLAQHTDYINSVEGDMVTPSKILNVFHDETMMTYENKFVNTLINRLYVFVMRRYDAIKESGRSEKSTMLRFGGNFSHGETRGRLNFEIEISEAPDEAMMADNPACSFDLIDRVERLYNITKTYTDSEFAKTMGKAYVKPPIMRTNAILKNKNLKQCLALWEFIESYEGTGYGVGIEEHAESADESYIKELYSTCALQYLIFRYKIRNDFEDDRELNSAATEGNFMPKFVTDIEPFNESDYNVFDSNYMRMVPYNQVNPKRRMSESEKQIAHAIDVALFADLIYDEMRLAPPPPPPAPEPETEPEEAAQSKKELNIKDRKVGRKKKKKIRKAAEQKAETEGAKLDETFNYVEYMRYLLE
ncbi:MAG: DUF2357 domain-containing protein [Eubacteriales bacterium]